MNYNQNADTAGGGTVLPAGQYEAVVATAREGYSQKGNLQMGLILKVYGPDGTESTAYDYLPAVDAALWKLKHFCESAGIPFDGNLLEAQCEGANVRVDLVVEKSEQYGTKNKVKDYLPRSGGGAKVTKVAAGGADDDSDLNF